MDNTIKDAIQIGLKENTLSGILVIACISFLFLISILLLYYNDFNNLIYQATGFIILLGFILIFTLMLLNNLFSSIVNFLITIIVFSPILIYGVEKEGFYWFTSAYAADFQQMLT